MMSAPPTTQYKMMGAPPTTTNLLIIEQKRVVAELVFERSLILSDLEKVEKHYRPVTYSLAVLLSRMVVLYFVNVQYSSGNV